MLGDNPAGRGLFQFMIVWLKVHTTGNIFGKIWLKAIRDTFFSNMWFVIRRWTGILNFRGWYPAEGGNWNFSLVGRTHTPLTPSSPISSLDETSDFLIKKALRRVFGLLTVRLLKRVSESIFFQNKACSG